MSWSSFLDSFSGAVATFLVSGLSFLLGLLFRKTSRIVKRLGLIEKGVLAILHDRIYQNCAQHMKDGYIDVTDRDNLRYMFEPYHGLGGNGTCSDCYSKVFKLPFSPVEKEGD